MNTANKLTLLRVIMIPAFLVVLYLNPPYANFIALAIFILASLTDLLDGQIARKHNQVTDFGKFMDPLADKCLVVAAMLWFVEWGYMPAWALLIVVVREFAVSGLRMQAANLGKVIAAGWSGKVKTASTMVCICIMLVLPEFAFLSLIAHYGRLLNDLCVAVIVITTLYSGIEYLWVNRKVFSTMK
ncbi:MAG: CDP-diacylglycerol--glycerol-3-phosphate 3-phosphatidyltransferase [Oscillospiraceae bacterium]|nr:CDP-diacylglycerol--glycerol-3-phosphate 3-phosphatidyltransferase [Oscillospiraceae bacterium]